MDSNQGPSVHRLLVFIALNLLVFIVAVFVVWLLIAILAAAVAPDDRPWSFFWCTLLLLGPLGVLLALSSSTPTTRGARRARRTTPR
jgi:hypothetical protein